jgi:ferrous iron transport protein A
MLVLPDRDRIMDKKLSELKPGQTAIIKEFKNHEIHLKLMEMGCLPGEKISIAKIAPLGDPVSVLIAGYTLSLRLDEAEHILVDVIS